MSRIFLDRHDWKYEPRVDVKYSSDYVSERNVTAGFAYICSKGSGGKKCNSARAFAVRSEFSLRRQPIYCHRVELSVAPISDEYTVFQDLIWLYWILARERKAAGTMTGIDGISVGRREIDNQWANKGNQCRGARRIRCIGKMVRGYARIGRN